MNELFSLLHIDPQSARPIYDQIRNELTWLIASDKVKEGQQLPPIRELAAALGVHLHTVRAAYHRLEEDGLVTTRPGRGTIVQPRQSQRTLRSFPALPSHTFGLLLPALAQFYIPFVQGIEDNARQVSALPFICTTNDSPEIAQTMVDQLIAKGVDGFIVASTSLLFYPGQTWTSFPPAAPVVYADVPRAPAGACAVLLDNEGAGYLATRHLVEHGHRQIALITPPLTWTVVCDCYLGYKRALQETGLDASPELIVEVPRFDTLSGAQGMQQLLQAKTRPTAVFAAADILALGAIQAVKRSGLRVPEDMAVVGYNDIEFSASFDPPLTTVHAPAYELGARAMELLQALRTGQEITNRRIVLPTELVIRRSCGCRT